MEQSNIYVGQTLLTFNLYTGYTGTVDECKILVEKPGGAKIQWTGSWSNGVISYNVVDGDIDIPGVWRLQAYIKTNSKTATGDIVTQNVLNSIK